MGDDYLSVWVDRGGRVPVLMVRGELDAVMADQFTIRAVRDLARVTGPVAVDLSLLGFIDCMGARALDAVLETIGRWRLTEVSGLQPEVSRLLSLLGMDLAARRRRADSVMSARGRQVMRDAQVTRAQSREMLLRTSMIMARLAATYSDLAIARQRLAEQEKERLAAGRMLALSNTARDLSARYRDLAASGAR